MWFVLIPIWSIGIIGLVLLLVGWIRGKIAEPPYGLPDLNNNNADGPERR
jgi:hypothetical protein